MKMCKNCKGLFEYIIGIDIDNDTLMKAIIPDLICTQQFLDNDNKVKSCLRNIVERMHKFYNQPERSKREDHESGCGALNTSGNLVREAQ